MANGAIKLQNSLGADLYPITPIDNVIVSSGTTATAKRTSVRATTSADNYHFPTEYAVALVSSALSSSINTKQATISAGYGIVLDGATVNNNAATVADVMGGTAQKMVDGRALMGALTLGQAVDVTSIPDGYTSSTYNENSLNVTTTSVGFAAFPKWAADLDYIMVADFVNSGTTSRTITPSGGSWIEGGSAAKTLPANTTSRMAMVFSGTSASHPAKFVLTGTGVLHADMLREYEVTKCTKEARDQLVALNTKNDYESYYTVKDDMVDPWTYIINMGASPTTTVAAGLAYQINAMTGSHTLTCNACPPGYVGRETFVRILLGSTGNVIVQTPLVLGTPLIANSINNCSVIYRDGQAILTVTDTLGGYIVTNTLTSGDGSLSAALTATGETNQFVMFDYQTVGSACPTGTAAAAGSKYIIGNGLTDTTITGTLNCGGNKITMHTLGLSAFTATSGTVAMRDVYIPNGATASMGTNGLFSIERLTGDSGTLYIGPTSNSVTNAENFEITDIKVTGYTATGTSIRGALQGSNGIIKNCELTGNRQTYGVVVAATNNNIEFIDTVISGNTGTYPLYIYNGVMSFSGCTINNRVGMQSGGSAVFKGSNYVTTSVGQGLDSGGSGCIVLTTGAVVDITGNTVANPLQAGSAGNIQFASGGATILYSSGSGSASYMMDNVTLPNAAIIRNDGIINMNNTQCDIPTSSGTIRVNDASFIGGSGTVGYFVLRSGVDAQFYNTRFTSAVTTGNALSILSFGGTQPLVVSGCIFEGATGTVNAAGYLYLTSGAAEISDCNFVDKSTIRVMARGYATFKDCHINTCRVGGGTIAFAGSNTLSSGRITSETSAGQVVFSSGAILDLTGNTAANPIVPGGSVVFSAGGATVYPSAGSASAYFIDQLTLGSAVRLTNTNVIDLNQTRLLPTSSPIYISGVTFTNGATTDNIGGCLRHNTASANITLVDCAISGCSAGYGAALYIQGSQGIVTLSGCTITANSNTYGAIKLTRSDQTLFVYDTLISNPSTTDGDIAFQCQLTLSGSTVTKTTYDGLGTAKVTLMGSNTLAQFSKQATPGTSVYAGVTLESDAVLTLTQYIQPGSSGYVTISSGAIIDLTGNTVASPISAGGGITVSGGCTIINSAGTSVSLAAGTYTKINKDGTTA